MRGPVMALGALACCAAAFGLAPASSAQSSTAASEQTVKVRVEDSASYPLSLKCYQFYDVAGQVTSAQAKAAKEDGESEADALASRVLVLKAMKAAWNRHIDVVKGGKKSADIDADLAAAGKTIVADANAGLGGDDAARARYEAIQSECKTYEKFEAGRPPVDQIAPPRAD